VSSLAACLVGLMVWCGERAAREVRRGRVRARISGPPADVAPDAMPGPPASVRPRLLWRARAHARRDEQLADAVGSMTAALRAGLSVPQSLAYAAAETPSPLGEMLRVVVDDLDLGVPLETALDDWAAQAATGDARLLAGVLRLHRRSGGDLPSVLDQVVAALRERRAAAREVRGLTAQARLSGTILGGLPIAFFGFLWLTSRRDIEGAFRSPTGIAAMAIGLTLEGIAFLWIRRLLVVR
jgi:tight adherence protein B